MYKRQCGDSPLGTWTSDGNTIDITLLCGEEYYYDYYTGETYGGPGSNSYSFIGTLVDGQLQEHIHMITMLTMEKTVGLQHLSMVL